MNNSTGIIYQNTGLRSRGTMQSYHNSPAPNFHNKTTFNVDLRGLKPSEKRRLIRFDNSDNSFNSRYCIGFEIEKNYFTRNSYENRGDNVGELALFKGFELDSSCGVEAITHILPLMSRGVWRNKVFNMFHQARHIIEDEFSPSNTDCGGHITLSVHGLTSRELIEKVRKYSGLIMSLYRLRLVNNYVRYNMTMQSGSSYWINAQQNTRGTVDTSYHSKYCFCKVGDNGTIEFRVPPRVQGVKQLMRRYELFYELIDCAVSEVPYSVFLNRVRPILASMYPNQEEKVNTIIRDSRKFQRFIDSNGERTCSLTDTFIQCNTEERNNARRHYISTHR
jgi:hypothetical protein